jgi:hypothetical protein
MSTKRQASFHSSYRHKVNHSSYGTIHTPSCEEIHPPVYILYKQLKPGTKAHVKFHPAYKLTRLVNELEIVDSIIILSEIGISNFATARQYGNIPSRFNDYCYGKL